jgi:hypothetical protein
VNSNQCMFLLFIYICIANRDQIIKRRRVGITVTFFSLSQVEVKLEPGFLMSYFVVFFMFNGLRCKVVVHFVDIE